MNLLVPGALGLAALALPLIGLYMLRSRRRKVTVPSTMLWQSLDVPVSSAVPWQRLRMTPLLWLQLAALALFVLALARPYVFEQSLLGPHTVFVVDTSGSMAMAGRFDAAVERAVRLVDNVSDANLVSVIDAGTVPTVVAAFSASHDEVVTALTSLQVTGGVSDLSGAIRMARALATPDRPTNLVLLSDGGLGPLPEEPVVGADQVSFVNRGDNLAVESVVVESTGGVQRAFVSVANHTVENTTAMVEVSIDGRTFDRVEIPVAGLSAVARRIPVDAEPGAVVKASLVGEDALPLDDTAWTVVSSGAEHVVQTVGQGSPFLEGLIDALPGVVRGDEGDLLVVDRGEPPVLDRPVWLIRPERPPEGMTVTEIARNLPVTYQRPGEPILDAVDLSEVVVGEAQVVDAPGWLPIVRSGDVPLILLGNVEGNRTVYATFDLTHSNLPVQVAFPILGANLFDWLEGGSSAGVQALPAGTPIPLLAPAGATAIIEDPAGELHEVSQDAAVYTDTGSPGAYRVSYRMPDDSVEQGPVEVRNFAVEESDGGSRTIATQGGLVSDDAPTRLVREWGPWVIALSLMLMAVEWWVGHQRPWRPGWVRV